MNKALIVLLSLVSLTTCPHSATHKEFAHDLTLNYVFTRDKTLQLQAHELQLILNLVYLSYSRSESIMELQEKALEAIDKAWQGWEHVSQLRINPGYALIHKNETLALHEQLSHFTKQLEEFSIICSYYVELIQLIESKELSKTTVAIVREIQSEEQLIVAEAIAAIKEHVSEMMSNLTGNEQPSNQNAPITKGSSILDFVWACLPTLAVTSFLESDQLTFTISRENWTLLKTLQKITNINWRNIEQARSAYFYTLYKQLYEIAVQNSIDTLHIQSVFEHSKPLPKPDAIES